MRNIDQKLNQPNPNKEKTLIVSFINNLIFIEISKQAIDKHMEKLDFDKMKKAQMAVFPRTAVNGEDEGEAQNQNQDNG